MSTPSLENEALTLERTAKATHTTALLLYVAGVGFLSIMDATVKQVASRYSTAEVSFLRFATGTIVIGLIVAWMRPGWPSLEMMRVNGVRSLLTVMTSLTFFFALTALPLAETVALTFLTPAFLALFGAWILKERLSPKIGLALGVGFLGMLVIVGGQIGTTTYGPLALAGACAALAAAVFYALGMVLLRSRAAIDPIPLTVLVLHIGATAILAVPAALAWRTPTPEDALIFGVIGVLGVGGHLLLANAFARAQAGRLAALEYTALLWAAGLGYVFFAEVPGIATVVGAGFIVASAWLAHRT
jgi:drug/metabolite transporter (DMT)-like permease